MGTFRRAEEKNSIKFHECKSIHKRKKRERKETQVKSERSDHQKKFFYDVKSDELIFIMTNKKKKQHEDIKSKSEKGREDVFEASIHLT